ncbi:MAG: hypothetical protein R3C68_03680 [Myxococcota bacterium]
MKHHAYRTAATRNATGLRQCTANARELGVQNGDLVRLETRRGKIRLHGLDRGSWSCSGAACLCRSSMRPS